jgi:hypothetical protein
VGDVWTDVPPDSLIRYHTRLDNIVLSSDNCYPVSSELMFADLENILDRLLAEYDMPQVLEDSP